MNTETTGPHSPNPATEPLALGSSEGLGPPPPADPSRALQYGAIRYVPGYPESYLHEYARAYAAEQVAAERERCAQACRDEAASIRAEGEGCTNGQYDFMADGAERAADAIEEA